MDTNLREISDIFDVNGTKGLSRDIINNLPIYEFPSIVPTNSCQEMSCAICLLVRIFLFLFFLMMKKQTAAVLILGLFLIVVVFLKWAKNTIFSKIAFFHFFVD